MILKIEPIFIKKTWGGNNIKKLFDSTNSTDIINGKFGEVILVSGEGENVSRIIGTNKFLDEFYKENKEKFFNNYYKDKFPILIKLIDAGKDLPIIVNPKVSFFSAKKNLLEKNEIWYPIELNEREKFVVGIKKKSILKNALKDYNWKFVFEENILEKNKAYNIKSGTVHGIKANSLIYSIEDNINQGLTVYDEKNSDELLKVDNAYIKKILKSMKEKNIIESFEEKEIFKNNEIKITELGKNINFALEEWEVKGKVKLKIEKSKKNFLTITCVDGHGLIGKSAISKNENIIVTSDELDRLVLDGKMKLLVAYPHNMR